MQFTVEGKVALVTGGASGIGLNYAKEFLRNGLRGVTLADVNEEYGEAALKDIEHEFGPNKAIFVKTDVTNLQQFDNAFKECIEYFKNIDILVNNAGILNDAIWEKELEINVNGTIHGMILGLDKYIPRKMQGSGGVIVNISSIAGLAGFANIPVYCATKFAVIGLTASFGDKLHYQRTKVKVIALCPGVTETPLIWEMSGRNLGENYEKVAGEALRGIPSQEPEDVARALVTVVRKAPSATIWVAEAGQDPYEYLLVDRARYLQK